jgi:hypothetical protein
MNSILPVDLNQSHHYHLAGTTRIFHACFRILNDYCQPTWEWQLIESFLQEDVACSTSLTPYMFVNIYNMSYLFVSGMLLATIRLNKILVWHQQFHKKGIRLSSSHSYPLRIVTPGVKCYLGLSKLSLKSRKVRGNSKIKMPQKWVLSHCNISVTKKEEFEFKIDSCTAV